jgi:hypothetical protein
MPLSAWLLMIPQWFSLLLVTAFFTGFGVGLVLLTRKLFHHSILKHNNEMAGFMYGTLGGVYGIVLAFVVVVVFQQFNAASATSENEAMQVYALYRDLSMYPDQE